MDGNQPDTRWGKEGFLPQVLGTFSSLALLGSRAQPAGNWRFVASKNVRGYILEATQLRQPGKRHTSLPQNPLNLP